jgi:hypothetical protein
MKFKEVEMLKESLNLTSVKKIEKKQIVLRKLNRFFKRIGAQKVIGNIQLFNCDFGGTDSIYRKYSSSRLKDHENFGQKMMFEID